VRSVAQVLDDAPKRILAGKSWLGTFPAEAHVHQNYGLFVSIGPVSNPTIAHMRLFWISVFSIT